MKWNEAFKPCTFCSIHVQYFNIRKKWQWTFSKFGECFRHCENIWFAIKKEKKCVFMTSEVTYWWWLAGGQLSLWRMHDQNHHLRQWNFQKRPCVTFQLTMRFHLRRHQIFSCNLIGSEHVPRVHTYDVLRKSVQPVGVSMWYYGQNSPPQFSMAVCRQDT